MTARDCLENTLSLSLRMNSLLEWNLTKTIRQLQIMKRANLLRTVVIKMLRWLTLTRRIMSNWCPIKNSGENSLRITYVSKQSPSEATILFSFQEWPIQKNTKTDTSTTNNRYLTKKIGREIPNLTNRRLASSRRQRMTSILWGILALMTCPLASARSKLIKKLIYLQKLMLVNQNQPKWTQTLTNLKTRTQSGTR